jgi:hypothetical protein
MRIALALLVVVLAIAAGFAVGWIAHVDSTLLCRDTRPTHVTKIDLSQPAGKQGGDTVVDPTTPLTMRCETKS